MNYVEMTDKELLKELIELRAISNPLHDTAYHAMADLELSGRFEAKCKESQDWQNILHAWEDIKAGHFEQIDAFRHQLAESQAEVAREKRARELAQGAFHERGNQLTLLRAENERLMKLTDIPDTNVGHAYGLAQVTRQLAEADEAIVETANSMSYCPFCEQDAGGQMGFTCIVLKSKERRK